MILLSVQVSRIISTFCIFTLATIFQVAWAQENAELIDLSTNISIDQKGQKTVEQSYLIRINDKASNWIADINIPYGANERVEVTEATILDNNFQVLRKIKNKEIIDRSSVSRIALYEDDMVKSFSMNAGTYPYYIRYSYKKIVDQFIYVAYWYPYLYPRIPVHSASLKVRMPKGYAYQEKVAGKIECAKEEQSEVVSLDYRISDCLPQHSEVFSPPIRELSPHVWITPKEFHYSIPGKMDSWSSFGQWKSEIIAGLDELPISEKQKVHQMVDTVQDVEDKIALLYNYMQDNHRYIYVGIEEGGLVPYSAEYVCENRYGDCKALTIYMKSLLKEIGVKSYYTTVYAGSNPRRVDKSIPGHQSNHIILAVPIEGDTIWLENTSKNTPYNYLGTFTQNREVLLINGSDSKLVRTPALTIDQVKHKSTYHYQLDSTGQGFCDLQVVANGPTFEKLVGVRDNLSQKDQKEWLSRMANLQAVDLQTWSFFDGSRNAPSIRVTMKSYASKAVKSLGEDYYIEMPALSLPKLESPDKRDHPVRINYPYNKEDHFIWQSPLLLNLDSDIPDEKTISSSFGSYKVAFQKDNDKIIMTREYILNSGTYELSEYKAFYVFLKDVERAQKDNIVVLNR